VTASREALPILLLACACGASLRAEPADGRASRADAAPKPAASATEREDAAKPDPRADALRDRGASIAPGMRLAAQRNSPEAEVDLVHADAQDECVRVAYDANDAIAAELINGHGDVLARATDAVAAGVLPSAGPVCVRRGDAIRGVAIRTADAGAGTAVRWAAWAAP
jgi:hypothetical protein